MRFHQLGCFLPDKSLELLVVGVDFLVQSKPASRDGAHGCFGRCCWGCDLSRSHGRHMTHQSDPPVDAIERVPQLGWRIYDQRFQCDHCLGLGFHGAVPRYFQMADHFG